MSFTNNNLCFTILVETIFSEKTAKNKIYPVKWHFC